MKKRLIEFLAYLDIGQNKFEEKVGLSIGYINKLKGDMKLNTINKIISTYPELNKDWLITGEGSMLKTSKFPNEAKIREISSDFTVAPLISQYAYAGYLAGYSDETYIENQPIYVASKKYTPGNYVAFEVSGDSMDDGTKRSICNGDVVLGRELYREHWNNRFRKDEVYIIVHNDEGICIKEIINHDIENGIIICHSWNPEHEDFKVYLKDILKIFYKKELRRS